MAEKIIELLALDGRHTRSIALNRDLHDPHALERYVITPNSMGALRQIGEGIVSGQAQRAWKIVGPYGSGKSAFGILLAQLLAGEASFPVAAKYLTDASLKIAKNFVGSRRFSVAVVGSRVSFGSALASAIDDALTSFGKTRALQKVRRKLDIQSGTYASKPVNAATGEMVADLVETVKAEGYEGLLLLIDEVGKFVEHAALHPEHGDLIALQQVAEYACKADDNGVVVIAMLHQHFASYAAGVGRALGDEWHKVAARFEEIPFDEPVERYAHFAKQAFGGGKRVTSRPQIVSAAHKEYEWAIDKHIIRAPSAPDKALFKRAEYLFPLHPLVLAAAATISKRYGQSERSFHAFLYGGETYAMRDFAQRTEASPTSWYRVQDLYDYLAHGSELRFRDLDAERKWSYARTIIEQRDDIPLELVLLKAIAILELVKINLGIKINAEMLGWAIGEVSHSEVFAALSKYVELGILIKRHKDEEYAFGVSSAVNIEALYEKAARVDESELLIKGTVAALAQKLVVANRHYDETGTIRTVSAAIGTLHQWPSLPVSKSGGVLPDAWIKLVLISEDVEQISHCEARFAKDDDLLMLHAFLPLPAEGRAALAEYAIWSSIAHEINAKSLDPWLSRYVDARVSQASDAVERYVISALTPSADRNGPTYWHRGRPIEGSAQMNLSQVASWLFSKVYDESPRIVNELINKDRPTSAIVLARQRMFEVILAGDSAKAICAENEYPPERLIHTTLLKQTGIWIESEGRWSLNNPDQNVESKISAVWREISRVLREEQPRNFAEALDALAAPPFGVRNGPAGVWIALYLIINRNKCAIFERGSLVLELTAEHLMRMYKNPQAFTIRELPSEDTSRKLISDYREALSSIGCQISTDPSFLEMTRALYRWFARLPDFTRTTTTISKDAAIVRSIISKSTDPIALLTQTLPKAYADSKAKDGFKLWLTKALTDLGMAHRRLQDLVATELSRGFGIVGPLSRIRAQLQNECTREATTLADAELKSFILRCTDVLLTDERWLDSVGSLIAHRPLDAWKDDTLAKFQQQLTELCGRYRRWMQIVMQRGAAPRASDRFLGLTLTTPGGEEASVFVTRNEVSDLLAEDVLALIERSSNGDLSVAAAALAHALLKLQNDSALPKEASNG